MEYRDEAQFVVMFVVSIWALIRGGGPERFAGAILLTLFLSDRLYHLIADLRLGVEGAVVFHALNDGVVCIAFVVLALFANRMYTLWLAALQILALNAHLVHGLSDQVSLIAYAILYTAPSYIQIGILLGAMIVHRRRVKEFGDYRDWRPRAARRPSPG